MQEDHEDDPAKTKAYTLAGASLKMYWSERKLAEWHGAFIRCVARKFGLL